MKNGALVFGLGLLAILVALVAYCALVIHKYNSGLAAVEPGNSEARVIALLGSPSYTEPAGHPYLRYTGAPCAAPCVRRLWWEWPIFPGIEAWSVELGSNNQVLKTYHWVSP